MNFQSRFGISNASWLEVMENICNWQMVRGIIFLFSFFVPLPTPLDELGLCMANKFLRKWLNTLYQRSPKLLPDLVICLGVIMAMIYYRETIERKISKGCIGDSLGKTRQKLPRVISQWRDTGHISFPQLWVVKTHVKCCLLESRYRLSTHGFFWGGSWSLGTFCLSCTPVPDSQKESRVLK